MSIFTFPFVYCASYKLLFSTTPINKKAALKNQNGSFNKYGNYLLSHILV